MAILAFEPYVYKPTAPRSKSKASHRNAAPEQVNILNKLQHDTSSGVSLNTPQPVVDNEGYKPGIRGTGTVFGGSEKANNDETDDNDQDPSTIEELLFNNLQAQGFTTGDRGPDKIGGVEKVAADGRGGFVDQSRSAQGDNSGRISDDPIVLLGDGNFSTSKGEANDVCLRAESTTTPGAGLLDSPEIVNDLTTLVSPRNSDRWHGIDDFLEPAPRSRLAQQEALTSGSLSHTFSSRLSREELHYSINQEGLRYVISEATTSSSPPPQPARESPETQLSQEVRLHTGRGVADEDELVDHAHETLLIDERARTQQEVEQEQDQGMDEGNTEGEDERPQQEMTVMAPVVTAERAGRSPRLTNRRQSLPNPDPSPELSYTEAGSWNGGDSDDELNSNDPAEDDKRTPRPIKRKQLSSSHDGLTRKKHKRRVQESSSCQSGPPSMPYWQYLKLHHTLDQCSRVATSSSAEGWLPLPTLSTPQGMVTKTSLGDSNLSPSSRATPPTLIEITFRPHSEYCYSFTALIRDGCDGRGVSLAQLARLIASTGHVGKIVDFTIKPIKQHLYLLSGFSRHTPSLITPEAGCDHVDAARTRTQVSKAVDSEIFTSWGSEPSNSNDDESGLSDSDPELGIDCDSEGYSNEDELGRSASRMNVLWDPIDEQRLLAYKKENKSWKWIFQKFPGRTPAAVRTRWTMVQRDSNKLPPAGG